MKDFRLDLVIITCLLISILSVIQISDGDIGNENNKSFKLHDSTPHQRTPNLAPTRDERLRL